MARGRLISRTLGSSRKFAALPQAAAHLGEFAQTLYQMLVSHSDDFGRLSGDAFTVKHAVFPTSSRCEQDFADALVAMATVGLIRYYVADGEQVIQIVDFDEHQPGLSKRTRSRFPEDTGVPVKFTEIPEIPSQEKRRELNRREGKRNSSEASSEPEEPAVLTFPVVGLGGPTWGLTQGQIDQWRELFPGIDVLAECRAALAWAQANKGKRKTATGMLRFLAAWLTRANDQPRPAASLSEMPVSKLTNKLAAAGTAFLNRNRGQV
ncbi:MAG: hypothetical protein NUW01_06585 [Gemmatimonadaceae bacterium]|nr:hypothetical protein [Gemmatimonadaceae bacterium]